jgi:hypothetical protein
MPNYTLQDIAKLDAGVGSSIIDETLSGGPLYTPELEKFPAETIVGNAMTLSVLSSLPTASFRQFNEGVARSKANFENKTFQTFTIDHQVAVDKKLVDAAKDPSRLLNTHAVSAMRAVMRKICGQIWYGVSNDADGFPGMLAQYAADSDHEVNGSGSSNKSSVWFLQLGQDMLQVLFGNNSSLSMASEWTVETIYDSDTNPYQAYTNWITGSAGLRLANKHAAVRIKNLASATQVLTDTLMYSALEKCEELGMTPNAIFGRPRSFYQLRSGRTATNQVGLPAPLPREWEGIPLIPTTNITIAES